MCRDYEGFSKKLCDEIYRWIEDSIENSTGIDEKLKPCVKAYLLNSILLPSIRRIYRGKDIDLNKFTKKVSKILNNRDEIARLLKLCNLYMLILSKNHRRIVDIGCGLGLNLNIASSYLGHSPLYIGIDKDMGMLNTLKILYSQFEVIQADASNIPLRGKSIDLVTCTNVIHELPSLEAIKEIKYILRYGGYLLIIDIVARYIPHPILDIIRRGRTIFKMEPETPYKSDQIVSKIRSIGLNIIFDITWWRLGMVGAKALVAVKK